MMTLLKIRNLWRINWRAKWTSIFASSFFFVCPLCNAGSSIKNANIEEVPSASSKLEKSSNDLLSEKNDEKKCSLIIPKSIEKNIPQEMRYSVFLQLIFNLIRTEYVKNLSECEIIEKCIAGALASLDPHSSYLNEKTFASLRNQTDGEFGGIGIEIMIDEGFIRIISPIDDTPAYKAGLKCGDLIIYIDNECINGITSEEAVEKLRGKPRTKVKLKIKRDDKIPFDIEVERDIIKVQSVKAEILDNIGYIRISTFDKNTSRDVKKFIHENKNKNLHGIILDLRNNPGGLLDEAVSVSNIFLNGGKIVSTRGRTAENTRFFSADAGDLTNGLPLVVMINSGTASAPEIVAGALRDNKRAIIVGVRSFGKGSVQKVIPLSEKTAIKLTVAKHYTPSGECIQANGISPDIEADYAMIKKPDGLFIIREEFFNNAMDVDKKAKNKKFSDAQNKKSIDELGKKKDKKDAEEEDQELLYRKLSLEERVVKDYQLSKAFDAIKVLKKFDNMNDGKNEKK
ncbi:MAG: S41 family peptidase [Holosporaceae bacterium]|jgi:carboxyl-terminal processing protease|nr:S41 family peptidase [Holosporaceae bacterium]